MRQNILSLLLFVIVLMSYISAQCKVEISGYVYDSKTGEPLFMANVFLTNTTLGSATDRVGYFKIDNIPEGNYEMVVSYIGYEPEKISFEAAGNKIKNQKISLSPKSFRLKNVVIEDEDPTEWRRLLRIFKKQLLGTSKNSKDCHIINPEVINLKLDKYERLIADTDEIIKIKNEALGYNIDVVLHHFEYDRYDKACDFAYDSYFTKLKPESMNEFEDWQENRLRAYKGSFLHFLRSLLNQSLVENEFYISERNSITYYDIITKKISQRSGKSMLQLDKIMESQTKRTTRTKNLAEKILKNKGDHYSIHIDSTNLKITFAGEPEEEEFFNRYKNWPRKKWRDYQSSWLSFPRNEYSFDKNGSRRGFSDIALYYGYWSWERLADKVPIDYYPLKKIE